MDPRHYYRVVHLAVDSQTRSSLVLLKIDYSLLIGGLYNTILMRRDQIVGAYTACHHVMSANTVAGLIFTSSLIVKGESHDLTSLDSNSPHPGENKMRFS